MATKTILVCAKVSVNIYIYESQLDNLPFEKNIDIKNFKDVPLFIYINRQNNNFTYIYIYVCMWVCVYMHV